MFSYTPIIQLAVICCLKTLGWCELIGKHIEKTHLHLKQLEVKFIYYFISLAIEEHEETCVTEQNVLYISCICATVLKGLR